MLRNGDLELSIDATLEIRIRELLSGCDRSIKLSMTRA